MRDWRSWNRSRRARCRATIACSIAAPARAGRATATSDRERPRFGPAPVVTERARESGDDGSMHSYFRLSLVLAALLACPSLHAQQTDDVDNAAADAVTLDRVVVQASRLRGVNAFDMPAPATVVPLDGDAGGANADVSEVLRGIPGVLARDRH